MDKTLVILTDEELEVRAGILDGDLSRFNGICLGAGYTTELALELNDMLYDEAAEEWKITAKGDQAATDLILSKDYTHVILTYILL